MLRFVFGREQLRKAAVSVAMFVVAVSAVAPAGVSAGSGFGANGAAAGAAANRPIGAVKLTAGFQKSVGLVRCGKIRGVWLPGTKLAGNYFITHAQQATNYKKLAGRSTGNARAKHLRTAAKSKSKARSQLARCKVVTPPVSPIVPPGTPPVSPIVAPGTPPAPTVVAGVGSATVTVSAGSGGAPVSYTVTASPGGGSCTIAVPATSCVVTGLSNSVAYTFSATATNAGGSSAASAPSASITLFAVGSTGPGGGIVFYVSELPFTSGAACGSSCRYLEAAPVDWNGGPGSGDPELAWGGGNGSVGQCSNNDIPGATGLAVGTGFANTAAIMATCPDVSGNDSAQAARATDNYAPTVNGAAITDWFLPSQDELNALDVSVVGGLTVFYWSSSQFDAPRAYIQSTGVGAITTGRGAKHLSQSVKAVRAF